MIALKEGRFPKTLCMTPHSRKYGQTSWAQCVIVLLSYFCDKKNMVKATYKSEYLMLSESEFVAIMTVTSRYS